MRALAVPAAVGAALVVVVAAQAQGPKTSCGPLTFRIKDSTTRYSGAIEICRKHHYFRTVVYVNGRRLTYTDNKHVPGGFNFYAYGMETVVAVQDDQGTITAFGATLVGVGRDAPHVRVVLNASG